MLECLKSVIACLESSLSCDCPPDHLSDSSSDRRPSDSSSEGYPDPDNSLEKFIIVVDPPTQFIPQYGSITNTTNSSDIKDDKANNRDPDKQKTQSLAP